jgi:hypothetical protein
VKSGGETSDIRNGKIVALDRSLRRNDFYRGMVLDRFGRKFLKRKEAIAVILLSIVIFLVVVNGPAGILKISEAATAGLALSSMSFTACVAVFVLVLALPSEKRVKEWSKTETEDDSNVYLDLIFSITWATLAQLLLMISSVLAFIFGAEYVVSPGFDGIGFIDVVHYIVLLMSCIVLVYAIRELHSVVMSLFLIGNLTATEYEIQD